MVHVPQSSLSMCRVLPVTALDVQSAHLANTSTSACQETIRPNMGHQTIQLSPALTSHSTMQIWNQVVWTPVRLTIILALLNSFSNLLLFATNPALTGSYWMDPNGGSVSDAIEVTCRHIDNEWSTCIQPEENWKVRINTRKKVPYYRLTILCSTRSISSGLWPCTATQHIRQSVVAQVQQQNLLEPMEIVSLSQSLQRTYCTR